MIALKIAIKSVNCTNNIASGASLGTILRNRYVEYCFGLRAKNKVLEMKIEVFRKIDNFNGLMLPVGITHIAIKNSGLKDNSNVSKS